MSPLGARAERRFAASWFADSRRWSVNRMAGSRRTSSMAPATSWQSHVNTVSTAAHQFVATSDSIPCGDPVPTAIGRRRRQLPFRDG